MIGLPAHTRIWIVAGITDMRCGFNGLAAKIETALRADPFNRHVFVFRGGRGDIIKLLWWTGDGPCLLSKRLERGRFIWPQASSGTVTLTQAQLTNEDCGVIAQVFIDKSFLLISCTNDRLSRL